MKRKRQISSFDFCALSLFVFLKRNPQRDVGQRLPNERVFVVVLMTDKGGVRRPPEAIKGQF